MVDFQNLKGVAQKLSPPCPFEFWSLNGCQLVNFWANDFSFWLRVNEILLFQSKLSSQTKSFFMNNVNTVLTLQLMTSMGPELQSQNCVDVCYGKTVGLGAKLTKTLWKSNISLTLRQKKKSLTLKLTDWWPFKLQN